MLYIIKNRIPKKWSQDALVLNAERNGNERL